MCFSNNELRTSQRRSLFNKFKFRLENVNSLSFEGQYFRDIPTNIQQYAIYCWLHPRNKVWSSGLSIHHPQTMDAGQHQEIIKITSLMSLPSLGASFAMKKLSYNSHYDSYDRFYRLSILDGPLPAEKTA